MCKPCLYRPSLMAISRVGQTRISAPYMTVYLVISLPKIPYMHHIYMVLANPRYAWMWYCILVYLEAWSSKGGNA